MHCVCGASGGRPSHRIIMIKYKTLKTIERTRGGHRLKSEHNNSRKKKSRKNVSRVRITKIFYYPTDYNNEKYKFIIIINNKIISGFDVSCKNRSQHYVIISSG